MKDHLTKYRYFSTRFPLKCFGHEIQYNSSRVKKLNSVVNSVQYLTSDDANGCGRNALEVLQICFLSRLPLSSISMLLNTAKWTLQ